MSEEQPSASSLEQWEKECEPIHYQMHASAQFMTRQGKLGVSGLQGVVHVGSR